MRWRVCVGAGGESQSQRSERVIRRSSLCLLLSVSSPACCGRVAQPRASLPFLFLRFLDASPLPSPACFRARCPKRQCGCGRGGGGGTTDTTRKEHNTKSEGKGGGDAKLRRRRCAMPPHSDPICRRGLRIDRLCDLIFRMFYQQSFLRIRSIQMRTPAARSKGLIGWREAIEAAPVMSAAGRVSAVRLCRCVSLSCPLACPARSDPFDLVPRLTRLRSSLRQWRHSAEGAAAAAERALDESTRLRSIIADQRSPRRSQPMIGLLSAALDERDELTEAVRQRDKRGVATHSARAGAVARRAQRMRTDATSGSKQQAKKP